MPSGATPEFLSYHAMRLAWCRLALRQWLRRWGVYITVAVMVVGAGANSPLDVVAGAAGWLVLPLFYASGHGAWLLPATALQALAGLAAVWGLRALLWPAHWAEAERALPISAGALRRSDAMTVAVALTPLLLLVAAGAVVLLGANPDWLRPTRWRATVALAVAAAASLLLGVLLLQRLRNVGAASAATAAAVAPHPALVQPGPWGHSAWALLWLPLWRGPARRTGQALVLGGVALVVPALATLRWPGAAAWALAVWAALSLVVVTRANTLARLEFAALFEACHTLPLRVSLLHRTRAALCLLPLLPGAAALVAVLVVDAPGLALRPAVLVAYLLACLLSSVVEVLSAAADPAEKSSRWLFSQVLCIALATEVVV